MSIANSATSHILASATSTSPAEYLPLTRPSIDEEDIKAVLEVLRSGWITTGSKVRELEVQFIELTGCRHAIAVCSATAGLHLVLHALNIGPGDEVITPSLTWVSTVNLIELSGAKPVFVDVDRDKLMVNAEAIAALITPRTRLIVPVHFAGAPLDMEPIRALADSRKIALVEDAAHALGSMYGDSPVGKTGTAIFSLQAIKNVTTAEGGVICTDDASLAKRLRRLRFHGLDSDAFDRQSNSRLPNAEVVEPGYKYNLPDMNACLALGQMARLVEINARRATLAERYRAAFEKMDQITPLGLPAYDHVHAWHLFAVRLEDGAPGISRNELMAELKDRQIGCGLHFRAVHTHKYYVEQSNTSQFVLPNTEWNSERLISLPLFPAMRDADVDRVVTAIAEILSEAAR